MSSYDPAGAKHLSLELSHGTSMRYLRERPRLRQVGVALLAGASTTGARADEAVLARFPEVARLGALEAPAEYHFDPGSAADGVTLTIPLMALPALTRGAVDAAVPGLAEPRIVAALRSGTRLLTSGRSRRPAC